MERKNPVKIEVLKIDTDSGVFGSEYWKEEGQHYFSVTQLDAAYSYRAFSFGEDYDKALDEAINFVIEENNKKDL